MSGPREGRRQCMGNNNRRAKNPIVRQPTSENVQKKDQLEKKLIWPYLSYVEDREIDSYFFRGNAEVYENKSIFDSVSGISQNINDPAGYALGIREFWEAFSQSSDILFADPYFAPIHYRRMIKELEKISNTRGDKPEMTIIIYGRNNMSILNKVASELKRSKAKIYSDVSISIGELPPKDIVHDRFAIMDGEIWHCGAAIGGMHGALNAVSRGWFDEKGRLKNFFIKKGVNAHVV